MSTVFGEMKRVCRPGGKILLIARGLSYVPLYNKYLEFNAAKNLIEKGYVEHIDFKNFIENQRGLILNHKERKNVGMTYIYILEV